VSYSRIGPAIDYRITMPNGHVLLDEVNATLRYQGSLYLRGDDVVEVVNRSSGSADYTIDMWIH